jgi:hypothetical protein
VHLPLEAEHGVDDAGGDVDEIDSSVHGVLPSTHEDETENSLVTRHKRHRSFV